MPTTTQTVAQEYITVNQQPDGLWAWRHHRPAGFGTTGRTRFRTCDEAAQAATAIAECRDVPLAEDILIFAEMDSPFYSGHVHEMEVA